MEWRWGLGGVILGVVILAFYVQILTARHRSFVLGKRHRERRFRPDWDRGRAAERDPKKRRGIRISR